MMLQAEDREDAIKSLKATSYLSKLSIHPTICQTLLDEYDGFNRFIALLKVYAKTGENARIEALLKCIENFIPAEGSPPDDREIFYGTPLVPMVIKMAKKEEKIFPNNLKDRTQRISAIMRFCGELCDMPMSKDDTIRMFISVEFILRFSAKVIACEGIPNDTLEKSMYCAVKMKHFSKSSWPKVCQPLLDEGVVRKLKKASEIEDQLYVNSYELLALLAGVQKGERPIFDFLVDKFKGTNAFFVLCRLRSFLSLIFHCYKTNPEMAFDAALVLSDYMKSKNLNNQSVVSEAIYFSICNSMEYRDRLIKEKPNIMSDCIGVYFENSSLEYKLKDGKRETNITHLVCLMGKLCEKNELMCKEVLDSKKVVGQIINLLRSGHLKQNCTKVHLLLFARLYDQIPKEMYQHCLPRMKDWRKTLLELWKKNLNEEKFISDLAIKIEGCCRKVMEVGCVLTDFTYDQDTILKRGYLDRGEHTCSVCGKLDPSKRCGRCKAISYCSKECATSDWEKHKEICGKPSTKEDSTETESTFQF